MRLRHRERGAKLTRGEERQVALLLLVGAVHADHVAGDEAPVHDPGQRHPAPRELHHDQRVGVERQAEAAVLLRDRHPEQAHLPHLRDERLRELVRVLQVGGDGNHLAVDELADRGDDLPLLVAQPVDRHATATPAAASGASAERRSSCSSSARIASSRASSDVSESASDALPRNFSRTSLGESGFSGPPFW